MTANHQLICGDCLGVMRAMPSKSVQMTLCSPPYEAARTYGIDFALRGQAWVDWCVDRFVECLRVTEGLVAWVVEGQTRGFRWSATPALLMADLHRRGVHLRKPPIFHRVGIPGSGGPDWLRNDFEFIVCAGPGGKLPWSDNTAMGHPPKWAPGGEMSSRLTDGSRVNQWGKNGSPRGMGNKDRNGKVERAGRPSHVWSEGGKMPETRKGDAVRKVCGHSRRANGERARGGYDMPVKANPGNVIKCNVGGGVMGHRLCHENEAPFPEALVKFFIRSFCPPGGTVLDPFGGSGTTADVAQQLGRRSISIDIRESQIKIARQRLAERYPGPPLGSIP